MYEWQLDKTRSVRAKLREKLLLWQFYDALQAEMQGTLEIEEFLKGDQR